MRYTVKKLPEDLGNMPLAGEFAPENLGGAWAALEEAAISVYAWDPAGYAPEARARVGWNEKGLHALLYAREQTIRAQCVEVGGRVCDDSCLEFFCMPFPDRDARYFNAEMNPVGTMHIGVGEGRHGRVKITGALPLGFAIAASEHRGGWWAVSYTVPMSYLADTFGETLASGLRMRGNFYKCDESIHPHFGSWAPVRSDTPDFHRPESFADMVLE